MCKRVYTILNSINVFFLFSQVYEKYWKYDIKIIGVYLCSSDIGKHEKENRKKNADLCPKKKRGF